MSPVFLIFGLILAPTLIFCDDDYEDLADEHYEFNKLMGGSEKNFNGLKYQSLGTSQNADDDFIARLHDPKFYEEMYILRKTGRLRSANGINGEKKQQFQNNHGSEHEGFGAVDL